MSTNIYHNHHIIPKYRCKEIGIDPDFSENIVRLTRLEHAEAHYHRWLKNGRSEDLGAAQFLARNEIDGIPIMSGENHPMWGRKHTPESIEKMKESWKSRPPISEETRKKMGDGNRGKTVTVETRKKLSVAQTGKTHSEETKKKMSESSKNIPSHRKGKTGIWSEETLKKFSEAKRGKSLTEEHKKKIGLATKKRYEIERKKNALL